MIQNLCMILHGITPLKTWILQIKTTTRKIKLIGYFDEIKFATSKMNILRKRDQKVKKQFYIS